MRIAIVNDLPMAVEGLRRIVENSGRHAVAWIAEDGRQAVSMARDDVPDLILMDMIMPDMDGVEATKQIMTSSPCPILVVTASVEDNIDYVFRAMGAGALDAVCTPVLKENNAGGEALLKKIDLIGHLARTAKSTNVSVSKRAITPAIGAQVINLVAVGASSGGPHALLSLLKSFDPQFPTAIVVAQHIDQRFAPRLVAWLNQQTTWQVQLASPDGLLHAGTVYIADSDKHLVMQAGCRLSYRDASENESPYRPSVNALFESLADNWPGTLCAVVLTGMGNDGASGLGLLRAIGHLTLAQDEPSSAVYGMPRAARENNAASVVLSPKDMGHYINHYFAERSRMASGS